MVLTVLAVWVVLAVLTAIFVAAVARGGLAEEQPLPVKLRIAALAAGDGAEDAPRHEDHRGAGPAGARCGRVVSPAAR